MTLKHFLILLAVLSVVIVMLSRRSATSELVQVAQEQIKKWSTNSKETTCEPQINWKSISYDAMTPNQMFQYLHWANSESCVFPFDFGGVVFRDRIDAIDGQKAVCLDEGIKPKAGKCLVYSFGINNEWSFDKTFDAFGCQVYSFDPSIERKEGDVTSNIHFYKIGLSHEDNDKGPNGWKMRTLDSIYKMLEPKHGPNAVIDYLKMDVEMAEWKSLELMMKTNILKKVKQIGVEIHFMDKTEQQFRNGIHILQQLEDYGMVRFASRPNAWLNDTLGFLGRSEYFGYEVAWFNKLFKP